MENSVKKRRREKGMSLRRLSRNSGVPCSTISEVENGKREPGVCAAIRIAAALHTSVEELFKG